MIKSAIDRLELQSTVAPIMTNVGTSCAPRDLELSQTMRVCG